MANVRSGTFEIFKKGGATKMSLMPPARNESGYISKNGAILVEAAPSEGIRESDGLPNINWKRKISFALGQNDIAQLLGNPEVSLVHTKDGVTKNLKFIAGKDNYAGTYLLNMNQREDGQPELKASVAFSAGEFAAFGLLLKSAFPVIIGWALPIPEGA